MALSELPSPPRPSDGTPQPRKIAPPARAMLVGTWLPFVLAAAWLAIVLRLVVHDLRFAVPLALLFAFWVLPMSVARVRERRLLRGGDVARVLEAWSPHIARAPFPETMQPLMIGTAYAANGWTSAAREALERARRGPAWAAAFEQRLVLETVLEAFDGDRAYAVRRAAELDALPLPAVSLLLRRRIFALRTGLAALARAFARAPAAHDFDALVAGAKASPLFHWAFSYAAAIVAIDRSDPSAARRVLSGAPTWGPDSVFRSFQEEINGEIARLEAERRRS